MLGGEGILTDIEEITAVDLITECIGGRKSP